MKKWDYKENKSDFILQIVIITYNHQNIINFQEDKIIYDFMLFYYTLSKGKCYKHRIDNQLKEKIKNAKCLSEINL